MVVIASMLGLVPTPTLSWLAHLSSFPPLGAMRDKAYMDVSISRQSARYGEGYGYMCCRAMWAIGRGRTSCYSWTETEEEVDVKIMLPKGTDARKVLFNVNSSNVHVEVMDNDNEWDGGGCSSRRDVLYGELRGSVKTDGCFWTLEGEDRNDDNSNTILRINLEKKVPDYGEEILTWKGVLLGEDTSKSILDYPSLEYEDFDVNKYVKGLESTGFKYDESKVDKLKFAELMKNSMKTALTKQAASMDTSEDAREKIVKGIIDSGLMMEAEGGDDFGLRPQSSVGNAAS